MNKYKTKKFYVKVKLIIHQNLKAYPRKWLLTKMTNRHIPLDNSKSRNLLLILKRLHPKWKQGQKLGVNLLRMLYSTKISLANLNYKQKEKIAKQMQHSVITSKIHYNKAHNVVHVIEEKKKNEPKKANKKVKETKNEEKKK